MLISVIIPCYNVEGYIKESILSVIDQTYDNFEIICVNDGSTDNTLLKLNELSTIYPNKIKVLSIENSGAPYARNFGLSNAKGDYIQFLDADDILMPDKFNSQIKAAANGNYDIIISDYQIMNENLEKVIQSSDLSNITLNPLNSCISEFISTQNPIYNSNFLKKSGNWNKDLPNAQDWEFNLRLFLNNPKIIFVKGIYSKIRRLSNSLSSNWKDVSKTKETIIMKYWDMIINTKETLNKNSYNSIFQIFYNNLLFSQTKVEFDKSYINYKQTIHNYYQLPLLATVIVKIIGFKQFLNMKRFLIKS